MGNPTGRAEANQNGQSNRNIEDQVMDVGQKVVFVRAVKGAEVGKHGTVTSVTDNMVVVDCTLQKHLAPVLAQMWDVLPERIWERLLKRRRRGKAGIADFETRF